MTRRRLVLSVTSTVVGVEVGVERALCAETETYNFKPRLSDEFFPLLWILTLIPQTLTLIFPLPLALIDMPHQPKWTRPRTGTGWDQNLPNLLLLADRTHVGRGRDVDRHLRFRASGPEWR